jgi:hypothetical protein
MSDPGRPALLTILSRDKRQSQKQHGIPFHGRF